MSSADAYQLLASTNFASMSSTSSKKKQRMYIIWVLGGTWHGLHTSHPSVGIPVHVKSPTYLPECQPCAPFSAHESHVLSCPIGMNWLPSYQEFSRYASCLTHLTSKKNEELCADSLHVGWGNLAAPVSTGPKEIPIEDEFCERRKIRRQRLK